jgi:hypothetical protein
VSTAAPTSNLDRITAFLRSKGFTAAQIAGIEGNLQVESGLSSTAFNKREGAIGIAQWEGGRRTNLQKFAASSGTSETNLDTQLAFMWSELTGSESSALAAVHAAVTPQQAATAFDQKYERSAASSLPARVSAAVNIAAGGIVGGSGQLAPGGSGTGGSGGVQQAGFLGDLLGGAANALGLTQIGHWIVDGFLIAVGVALVITAVVIIAKGSADGGSSTTVNLPGGFGGHGKGNAEGGTEGTAEEAAEVAA